MKKTKKAISVLLSLVLLLGVLPVSVLASETGQSVPVCICDTLCTGENINQDCPVCGAEGADLARCAGTGESGTGLPTDTETSTGTEPAAQTCICDTLCTDGSVNGGCPVCGGEGADLSKCLGKQVAEPTPEATPEPTQETTPEPTPETTPGPTPEAPEQEEAADEVDAAVAEVQAQIDALPAADGLAVMSQEEQQAVYTQVQAAYDAYNALTDEQKGQIAGTEIFDSLFGVFNGMVNAIPDEGEGVTLTGDGSSDDPYQIADAEDLKAFRDLVNGGDNDAWAVLTADIVLNENFNQAMFEVDADGNLTYNGSTVPETLEQWTPIGSSSYSGTFDGNGYTISGIYINNSSANYQGLFGFVLGGTVKNLGVTNSYIRSGDRTGGVAGTVESGSITNSYNTGSVAGSRNTGGVAGYVYKSTVTNCYNTGTVTGSDSYIGGVVGNVSVGSITNSYNTGAVSGGACTGGVAGDVFNGSTVANSYNTGTVSGNGFTGGVAGNVYSNGTVTNCYYLQGSASTGIGSGPGSAEAKDQGYMQAVEFVTLLNGDQDTISWQRDYNISGSYYNGQYPILDWQAPLSGGTGVNGDPFLIATKEDLTYFASLVNGGRSSIWGKLTANIDLNPGFTFASDGSYTGPEEAQPEIWNTMGQSESSGVYSGTFDGDGYAVSGVYINTNDGCQGLFGSITGTVRNLRVENSYISSGNGNSAGGIVAINWSGTVENCAFSGSVRGYNRVGGIVGRNRDGIVQNCYNTGTIQATQTGNGIAGTNNEKSAQVINCFTTTGSIADGGTITNSYYLSNNSSAAEALTAEEMSGPSAVTTMGFDSTLWISGGESQWEGTELDDGTVANILCGYLPHPSIFDEKQEFDWVALDSESGMSTQTDEDGKTYYLITNAAELATFRNIVNNALTAKEAQIYTPNASANGRLVNDIDLNPGYTFAADGAYTYSGEGEAPGVQSWIPIGTENGPYRGTFDGNGHTISSIYINAPSADYQGLFGDVRSGGIVRMVGVVNSYVFASNYVGGVVGANVNGGIVQNCYNTGSVSAGRNDGYVGGVAGYNYGTIQNCYNTGAVSVSGGDSSVGGVVGWNGDLVQSCYNTGMVNADASSYNGGITGFNITAATITNCYYLNTSASTGIGSGTGGATSLTAGQMTGSDALGQGETQMNLDTTVWTTGGNTTFWQDTGTVDENGQKVFGLMAQLPQLTVFADAGKDHEKIPVQTTTPSLSTQTDEDGKTYYLITNFADLVTFRNIVNNTLTAEEAQFYTADASSNGRLVNDIDLNPGYTFAADGTYTYSGEGEASGVQSWTPMGTEERQYTGIFDGGGHTVSGVYIGNGSGRQGLFGSVDSGGMIQNLGVVNSYIRAGGYYVGGIVGYAGSVTITSCFSSAAVIGTGFDTAVGGIVGGAYGATIENCYNAGMIRGEGNSARIGGVVGYINNAVENCYNTGSVSGNGLVGGVAGWVQDGSVINCYYLDTSAPVGIEGGSGDAKSLTIAQIEDAGENGLLSLLTAKIPADQKNAWNTGLSAVGVWTSGKPAVQPVFTWQMVIQNAPTYSVTIPEKATINSDAVNISANAGALRADQTVEVEVDANNIFSLSNGGTDSLTYQIFAGDSSDSVEAGETILSTGNTRETTSASIRFALKEGEVPSYAGTYTGTCTFVVSVKQSAS